MNMDKNIQEIPIEDIIPNRFQPRLSFNEEGINELAESIKQHGIIQPLVVRKLGDKYEIIAGERRYKASTMAGLTKVPVIISNIDDNKSAEVALVENIQRRNLTAIEEAKSYKNLLDRGYMTQEQLADKMGVSQSSIANKLRLLNLDEEVQEALLNEKISERHARSLLSVEDKEEQKKWLHRITDERLTVRQLDIELKKGEESDSSADEGIPLVNINPNLDEIISNAEDIKPIERSTHDVASMLIPESGVKVEPIIEPPIIEENKTEEKIPNKFFNFLEDEEANMSVIETEDIFNSEPEIVPSIFGNTTIEPTPEPEPTTIENSNDNPIQSNAITEESIVQPKNEVEILDELISSPMVNNDIIETPISEIPTVVENINNSELGIVEPIIVSEEKNNTTEKIINVRGEDTLEDTPIINIEPQINNEIVEEPKINTNIEGPVIQEQPNLEENTPFKSIFFNQNEDDKNLITPVIETLPENNTIEEISPVIEEHIIDPLDRIDMLEPDYEQKQEEIAGTDLKTAINTIRDTIKNLEARGFVLDIEEADLENIYHITIKINKSK